jgi:hypothetical protein
VGQFDFGFEFPIDGSARGMGTSRGGRLESHFILATLAVLSSKHMFFTLRLLLGDEGRDRPFSILPILDSIDECGQVDELYPLSL